MTDIRANAIKSICHCYYIKLSFRCCASVTPVDCYAYSLWTELKTAVSLDY